MAGGESSFPLAIFLWGSFMSENLQNDNETKVIVPNRGQIDFSRVLKDA